MKFEVKGKTEDGKWILWNYYTCNTIDDLKSKLSNLLLVSTNAPCDRISHQPFRESGHQPTLGVWD